MEQIQPQKGDRDYVDYVVKLGTGRVRDGVINEPRIYYDEIPQNSSSNTVVTEGTPGVFVNGEQFPIRLTHLTAGLRYLAQDNSVDNSGNIERIGLRMVYHDQFYMNPQFLPCAIWANKRVAMPQPQGLGSSHWDFVENGQPFVLSARDTLIVTVQLQAAPSGSPGLNYFPVNVIFTGIGALSHRPYLFNGTVNLFDTNQTNLSTVDFRNDGSEPIVITDMTASIGGQSNAGPGGDIGRLRFNVKQVGNGTNAQWFSGPKTGPVNSVPNCPAILAGVTSGRGVVHQFPGDGLIWEPGEGITMETRALNTGNNSVLAVGLAGYLMVT